MIDNVFILGAGASAEAGAPLMSNFLDKAEDLLRSYSFNDNNKIQNLFDVIHDLNEISAKASIDLNNIESILGALEMKEIISNGNKELTNLKESYIQMLAETIELSMNYKFNRERKLQPHQSIDNFFKAISKIKNTSAIITFNYDLAIDVALTSQKIEYSYNLVDNTDLGIPLLKLHGSLNWHKTDNEDIGYYGIEALIHDFRSKYFNDELTEKIEFKVITSPIPEKQKYIPFIIPPTWNKTMYHKSISSVWQKAASCLNEARNIFVLGYSLPESDSFFRYLYALGTQGPSRIRRFWVFNPDKLGTKERFKKLLGTQTIERFQYLQMKFSEAAEYLDENLESF